MHRRLQVILIIPIILVVLAVLGGCKGTPDESRIRQAISASATAAGELDAGEAFSPLTTDFDGNRGDMAPKDLANLMRLAKFRGETLHVVMGPVSVEPRGDRYVASFTVTLAGGGKLLPTDIGVYRVETAWRKEEGTWRCFSATWERAGEG